MPGPDANLIVIIDDNEGVQDSLRDLVQSAGFEVLCLGSAKSFLQSDLRGKALCLIVDVRMPRMSGLELQAKLKEEEWDIPVIFMTAFDDEEMRDQAIRGGSVGFLVKPFDHRLLLKMVRNALT